MNKNKYSKEFCSIYNEYGWDYFSITMGQAILDFLKMNNATINNHLDLCCGVGTLCDYFYNKGINTTGIDFSSDMVELCKKKNNNINFIVADMKEYTTDKKYDLITLTCDVVNHILYENDLKKIFSNIYNMLNNGGYLIFDIYNSEKLTLNKEIKSTIIMLNIWSVLHLLYVSNSLNFDFERKFF